MIDAEILAGVVRVGAATLVKSALVIAAGLIVASLISRRASYVSTLWVVVFGALLVSPWLGALLPSWNIVSFNVQHDALAQSVGLGPTRLSVAGWIVLAWGGGALLLLVRLVGDVNAAWSLARRASTVGDARTHALLDRALRVVSCHVRPQLLESTELSTAALIGWRKPRILLPTSAREWSDDELLGVLCHELEHARRNDWLSLIMERIAVAALWPNPLVHLAARASAGARELAADDAVFRAPVRVDAYASRLIAVARCLNTDARVAGAVALSSSVGIDSRVRALFEARRDRRPVSIRTAAAAATIALPLVVAVSAAQPLECVPGDAAPSRISICP